MKPLNVMIDMDAIVADLASAWYGRWNARFPDNKATVESVTQWDVGKAIGDTRIYSVLKEADLYRELKPIPGAIEGVKEIMKIKGENNKPAFNVFFLTASITAPHILADKGHWMAEHFPFITPKQMIYAYHKELVRGHVFIDDSPKNLKRIREAQGHVKAGGPYLVTIDYPYNRGVDDIINHRAYDYNDLLGAWNSIVAFMNAVRDEQIKLAEAQRDQDAKTKAGIEKLKEWLDKPSAAKQGLG